MMAAIQSLKKEPEPTMVVIPEVIRLPHQQAIAVQQQMLSHCGGEMKNRFAILDIPGGYLDENTDRGQPVERFRDALGTNYLDLRRCLLSRMHTSIFRS